MKRLLAIITTAVILTGCSIAPYHYDQNEYNLLVDLTFAVKRVHEHCGSVADVTLLTPVLNDKAALVEIYVDYSHEDKQMKQAVKIVIVSIKQLSDAYQATVKPSTAYCINKTQIIESELRRILITVGGKPQ